MTATQTVQMIPLKGAPTFAPCYAALYPMLAELARVHGYALAVHGSMQRDFDLVAVPWTTAAGDAETLIANFAVALGGTVAPRQVGMVGGGEQKPHGRVAYSIYLGQAYLDVSVTPRQAS